MKPAALFLLLAFACLGQDSETGRIERQGDQIRVRADSPRPVEAAATALADGFGIFVSVEDPIWRYSGDLKDASLEIARLRKGVMVPRGGRLEFGFAAASEAAAMMQALLEAANAQLPFQYRLDVEGQRFTLMPVRARNSQGEMTGVVPLLDRKVNIPYATRTIAETAQLMAEDLSKQTGLRVNCCEAAIAGLPWGMDQITFGADDKPAREVLRYLLTRQGGRQRWISRCDPQFCFINLR
jgi:hypothetical protein